MHDFDKMAPMKAIRFSPSMRLPRRSLYIICAFNLIWLLATMHQQGLGQAVEPKAYDRYIRTIDVDGSQAHPISSPCFRKVTSRDLPFLSAEASARNYCLMAKFFLDSLGRYQGYMLQIQDDDRIDLFVIDKMVEKVLLEVTIADHIEILHAMQSTTNSWFMDHNHDNVLDVLVTTKLIDYESETPDAPNISGTKRFCYTFVDGQMVYGEWPESQKYMPLMEKF
jgi:hypothetical protein